MIAFINEYRDIHGVEPICKVLPIAPSTYRLHAARQRDPSLLPDRARRDLVLMAEIERVFETNYSVYGARKVWRQLRREGRDVARCTVERPASMPAISPAHCVEPPHRPPRKLLEPPMKNTVVHVNDHLLARLEELSQENLTAEQLDNVVK